MPLPTCSEITEPVAERCFDDLPRNCATDDSCCNLSLENALRIIIPAGVGYAAGYGVEQACAATIAAISCCGCWTPAMTATTIALGGGCVRTHVPAIYQLDLHRKLWQHIMTKAGLYDSVYNPLIPRAQSVISTQPGAINSDPLPLLPGEEPSKSRDVCTRVVTRGIASFAPGFAFATMPAALSVYCPGSEKVLHRPELANALQAVVPSFCGFWQENNDTRTARRQARAAQQAYDTGHAAGQVVAAQPRA